MEDKEMKKSKQLWNTYTFKGKVLYVIGSVIQLLFLPYELVLKIILRHTHKEAYKGETVWTKPTKAFKLESKYSVASWLMYYAATYCRYTLRTIR
jgi:hypothetical protein